MKSAANLRKKVLIVGLEHYQNKMKHLESKTHEWERAMKEYRNARARLKALCQK